MEYLPPYKDSLYLEHHGILGMKWGVRRFQNKDGSLTDRGKTRYGVRTEEAKKELEKRKNTPWSSNERKSLENARIGVVLAKNRDEALSDKHKSDAFEKYKKQYLDKGLSEEDAATFALRKEKTRKILKVAGAIVLTAAVTYGAHKYAQYTNDLVIDSNTDLRRIAKASSGLHENAYVTGNKSDHNKYLALFAEHLKNVQKFKGEDEPLAVKHIKAKGQIKLPAPKKMLSISNEFSKSHAGDLENDFKPLYKQFSNMGPGYERQAKLFSDAISDIKSKKYSSKNIKDALVATIPMKTKTSKQFIDKIKQQGYGGLVDTFDQKYTGYDSKRPMVIFDPNALSVKSQEVINSKMTKDAKIKYENATMAKVMALTTLSSAGIVGSEVALKSLSDRRRINQVRKYRQEHPNSKLSDTEILDNLGYY